MERISVNLHAARCLIALALLACGAMTQLHSQATAAKPAQPEAQTEFNPQADASKDNAAAGDKTQAATTTEPAMTDSEQIAADTKKLYQLAAELRAEVSKTYKESLSLAVIKKAEEVEKLARSLKQRMAHEAAAAK